MQNLVSTIIDLTPKPVTQLLTYLKQQEQPLQQGTQQSQGANVQQCIQGLNPQQHTLGCVFLLSAWGSLGTQNGANEAFISAAAALLQQGDPHQLQASPSHSTDFNAVAKHFHICNAAQLAGHLRDHVVAANNPRRGILPLKMAMEKVAPSPEFITPMHAMFFQCCLLAKMPNAALPVLEAEVYDVDPAKTGMTPRDLLLYCYYGGLIHIARKRYPEALDLLLVALTAPSMVTNAITVAAWKKWALVNLIHNGRLPALPRWTSPAVSRAAKLEGAPYQDLATAYGGKSATVMAETVAKHHQEFAQEENMGLVKLVVDCQTKRNVLRLTQTYLTLALPDIAAAVGLPNAAAAELAILRMIDAGEVFAEIDSAAGMVRFPVRFLEDPQQFRGGETLEKLDAQLGKARELAARVAAAEHEVLRDRAYINKVHLKDRHAWQEDPSDFGVSEPPPPSLQFSTPPMAFGGA